jgi:hypothetical protein
MKRGFELLKTKGANNPISFSKIEDKLGFKFPPLFRLFHETFIPEYLEVEYFLNPLRNEKYILNAPLYEPLKNDEKWFLSISGFDSAQTIADNWHSYLQHEHEWKEFEFLRIANIGQGGGLYVGTRAEDQDMIYQVVWDYQEPYKVVAKDIFELMKGFVLPEIPNELTDGYLKSQLFMNYGENFWRIKE